MSKAGRLILGDCIEVMRGFPAGSIDFVLTDPPYLVNYKDRSGRSIKNDVATDWLKPAFAEVFRVLKPNALAVSFYGYTKTDLFFEAWKSAGFRVETHFTCTKRYTSAKGFSRRQHEGAYLLSKGNPSAPPEDRIPGDVLEWQHSGNKHHPTEKPLSVLMPFVLAYTNERDIVLDPFCGSGSSLVAAKVLKRRYVGIELDPQYHGIAKNRLDGYELTTD